MCEQYELVFIYETCISIPAFLNPMLQSQGVWGMAVFSNTVKLYWQGDEESIHILITNENR